MNLQEIRYVVLSDIHLGNRNNPTNVIIDNLLNFFIDNNKILSKVHIIFIAGDIFDTLLPNGGKELNSIISWMSALANYCQVHKIKLRILEGTQSHDWKQASTFSTVIKNLTKDIDYEYIDTLSIEYMEDLGIHVMYVPDEYKPTANETLIDIKNMLADEQLTNVDIAIMHGLFNYQLPIKNSPIAHNEEEYLSIVKYFINIGHVHTRSTYGRIIAQGSFDRIAHGEEEPKGAAVMYIREYGENSFIFLDNKRATIFKTITILDNDLISTSNTILDTANKLRPGSHLRVIVNSDNELLSNKKQLKTLTPHVNIKLEKLEDTNIVVDNNNTIISFNKKDEFNITPDNIENLLYKRLDKYTLTHDENKVLVYELTTGLKEI